MKAFKRLAQVALFLVFAIAGYVFWTYPVVVSSSTEKQTPDLEILQAQKKEAQEKTAIAAAVVSAEAFPQETQDKVKILNEIFVSKNDNDPRMDKELRVLSEADKKALRQAYQKLPLESRNDRGTIVFLLGRNLKTKEDYAFLKDVLLEAPCLSLENCFQNVPRNTESETHQDHVGNGMALVLDYPQLNALKAMQKHPAQSSELKTVEADLLQMAASSRSSLISDLAQEIQTSRQ